MKPNLNISVYIIQQKELKQIADKVLGEIRKKTQDITRATDLLKNLTKLRKLRKDRLLQQGLLQKCFSLLLT